MEARWGYQGHTLLSNLYTRPSFQATPGAGLQIINHNCAYVPGLPGKPGYPTIELQH